MSTTILHWTAQEQAEHRELWKQELLATDIPQATGALYRTRVRPDSDNYGACCLGIGCVLMERETEHLDSILGPGTGERRYGRPEADDRDGTVLPRIAADWLGLDDTEGSLDGRKIREARDAGVLDEYPEHIRENLLFAARDEGVLALTDLNDSYGWTFEEIALYALPYVRLVYHGTHSENTPKF